MDSHVSSHHRLTIEKIFHHPAGGNIEWRQVLSMLPRGKDIDEQMTVDLRRMLKQAGFGPDGGTPTLGTRQRDHGDGQWGEPN